MVADRSDRRLCGFVSIDPMRRAERIIGWGRGQAGVNTSHSTTPLVEFFWRSRRSDRAAASGPLDTEQTLFRKVFSGNDLRRSFW